MGLKAELYKRIVSQVGGQGSYIFVALQGPSGQEQAIKDMVRRHDEATAKSAYSTLGEDARRML